MDLQACVGELKESQGARQVVDGVPPLNFERCTSIAELVELNRKLSASQVQKGTYLSTKTVEKMLWVCCASCPPYIALYASIICGLKL